MTNTTPTPRRLSRKRSGPRTLTPRRAVVDTKPGPDLSRADRHHLAALTMRRAER